MRDGLAVGRVERRSAVLVRKPRGRPSPPRRARRSTTPQRCYDGHSSSGTVRFSYRLDRRYRGYGVRFDDGRSTSDRCSWPRRVRSSDCVGVSDSETATGYSSAAAPFRRPVTVIHATDLSKRYGDVLALDRVDLTGAVGETVGFPGPNGAGRSTASRVDARSRRARLPPVQGCGSLRNDVPVRSFGVVPRDGKTKRSVVIVARIR